MKKYDDINYIKTYMKGQVILQAGLDTTEDFKFYDVSIEVPKEFAKTILRWKKVYDTVTELSNRKVEIT